jgi:hypothetical protein
MKLPLLGLLLVTAASKLAAQAYGPNTVDVGFESPAYFTYNVTVGNGAYYHWMTEDNYNFDMPCTGAWTNPVFDTTHKYRGSRSLRTLINSSTGDKDRVEFRAIHGDKTHALKFGQTRFFGYAFRIDGTSQPPSGWFHLSQVWQRHDGTIPADKDRVPFTLSFQTGKSSFNLEAHARRKIGETIALPWIGSREVSKDVWHTLIFEFAPNHANMSGSGRIKIWLNNSLKVDWVGDWGQPPETGSGWSINDEMDIRCGIYRQAQAKKHLFYFDQVKVNTSKAAATP